MPLVHRAAWVLPIVGAPIRDGWVAVASGRISGTGAGGHAEREPRIILPGLVNCHTHLELSWMRGQVPPGDAMPEWASRLIGLRAAREEQGTARARAIEAAIDEARAAGTALVGDVTNTLEAWEPLSRSHLSAAVFFELIGFRADDPDRHVAAALTRLAALPQRDDMRATVTPHAPYSVSPELFRSIGRAAGDRPMSVHLAESAEEIQFLRDGRGPWRDLLEAVGAWNGEWPPPVCGPVAYLERLGLVNDRLIAVHGVQLTGAELERLATVRATIVTCPRSNEWTGAGTPPVEAFFNAGVSIAVGTDSLASVDDLNVFAELAAMRRLAPGVPARRMLEAATIEGARALGFAAELGSIEVGKRAELIAVRIRPDVGHLDEGNVEEYLVGGIRPSDIEWLAAD